MSRFFSISLLPDNEELPLEKQRFSSALRSHVVFHEINCAAGTNVQMSAFKQRKSVLSLERHENARPERARTGQNPSDFVPKAIKLVTSAKAQNMSPSPERRCRNALFPRPIEKALRQRKQKEMSKSPQPASLWQEPPHLKDLRNLNLLTCHFPITKSPHAEIINAPNLLTLSLDSCRISPKVSQRCKKLQEQHRICVFLVAC